MFKKKRSRRRRKKKFNATSIPALAPRTLAKGRSRNKRNHNKRSTPRRQEYALLAKLAKLGAKAWDVSHYAAMLLIALSLAGLGMLFTNPQFSLAATSVAGVENMNSSQIEQAAGVAGKNIFRINPDKTSVRLMTLMPQIKEARVSLGLPNRAVIHIEERKPALIFSDGNENRWVDAEGRIFPAGAANPDLPALIDEDGSASIDGARLKPEVLESLNQALAGLPDVRTFHHRQVYGLYFISPEGWRVYLGSGSNMANKLAMWRTLRQQILQEERQVKVVDLRSDRIYIQ